MNIIELLKTLRIRDKDIAKAMGVKVAQLNRRQKQIQQPSEESIKHLKNYATGLIIHLQLLVDGKGEQTNEPIQQENTAPEEIPNEGKPQTDDANETKIKVKSKKK